MDKGIHFGHLKWLLDDFCQALFGPDTQTRFRPGYFPFTEPSAEVDATCSACHGKGCRVCKGNRVDRDPRLWHGASQRIARLRDRPEEYTGFAFGMGIDRLANIKYNITDIRLLFEGDVRFLSQF